MKYDISSAKALIFDFDGTLIDSDTYKIETFNSLFAAYPEYFDEIAAYNKANRGVSRYIKLEYICRTILQIGYSNAIEQEIAYTYNQKLRQALSKLPLIKGIVEFIRQQKMPLFIATAAIHEEPSQLLEQHSIGKYFSRIYAHPIPKWKALQHVAEEMAIDPQDITFFGDALIDYEAAQKARTRFIARTDDPSKFPLGTEHIKSFLEMV